MRGSVRTAEVAPIGRLARIKHFLAEWCERRNSVGVAAISAVPARPTAAVSARRAVAAPDSGDIVFVVRAVGIFWIGSQYASATLRESAGRTQQISAQ